MPFKLPSWSESWRVLVYALAIALAFVALGRLELLIFSRLASTRLFGQAGLLETAPDDALRRQAAAVAEQSSKAIARLPAGHRIAVLRMGYEIGYASELTGSVALSDEDLQQNVRWLADKHVQVAQQMAAQLGIGPEAPLTTTNLQQFTELSSRIENDESGAAARIERQLSPLHRHLFLLGAHLGCEHARIETTGGKLTSPQVRLIRQHATLAGIDIELWRPLVITPAGESPEQVMARYQTALARLAQEVQRMP